MKKFQVELPDDVDLNDAELRFFIAAKLFEAGKLTSGQAAKIVGMPKRDFLESVGKFGVSIFQYSSDELQRDLEAVKRRLG